MPSYRYIFGQAETGLVSGEISLYGVSITNILNGSNDFTGTFQLDQTGISNQALVNATTPGRTFVVVERDGVPIWDGNMVARTYQSQAKSCQIWARSLSDYPKKVKLDASYYPDGLIIEDVEQTEAFISMWEVLQSKSESNLRLELPAPVDTGTTRTLQVFPYEQKYFGEVMDDICDGANGFDWRIITFKENGLYRRVLQVGNPDLGNMDSNRIVFDYPGVILNYWRSESLNDTGTHFVGLGAGEGENALTSTVIHQDRIVAGYLRWDAEIDFKDVHEQDLLDDLTLQAATDQKIPNRIFSVELRADGNPDLSNYSPGDYCTLSIHDSMHPNGYRKQSKLVGWRLTPAASDSLDHVQVYFEGREDRV